MANREPKVHVIDGVTYVEVERKAKVGDYVLGKTGKIRRVKVASESGFLTLEDGWGSYSPDYYVVLEPLESEEVTVDSTQASEQVIAMFTALSRKIVSLERQLADTQRNVERQAEELENAKHIASKALRVTGDHGGWLIRNAERLDKSEELIEMLTDDVITLDERTQVVNAITKFYEEGR